jgi:hypothetical protein
MNTPESRARVAEKALDMAKALSKI